MRATKETMVRGHWCSGLENYQAQAKGNECVPSFDSVGETVGCDDRNEVRIEFCPLCGANLATGENIPSCKKCLWAIPSWIGERRICQAMGFSDCRTVYGRGNCLKLYKEREAGL